MTPYDRGYRDGMQQCEREADLAYVEGYTDACHDSMWKYVACTVTGGIVSAVCVILLN